MSSRVAEQRKALVLLANEPRAYRERVPVWVELYPDYGPRSVVGVGEERSTIEEIQLSVVDRAERLAH